MSSQLPAPFLQHLRALEADYLRQTDPLRQSGFSGGADRWRAERAPILSAIPESGTLLDVGCANGYLLECLLSWGLESGLTLTPFGVDCSAGLIALARQRLPAYRDHFFVANAWGWCPPQRFQYVYALWDCVPDSCFGGLVDHLLSEVVASGGRLIIGAYGSRSRGELPAPVDAMLTRLGYPLAGSITAGQPETARFAWISAP
jgi:SAM-dependent methyltransferase